MHTIQNRLVCLAIIVDLSGLFSYYYSVQIFYLDVSKKRDSSDFNKVGKEQPPGSLFLVAITINMEIYTVSFFGHRIVKNFRDAEIQTERLINRLLCEKSYVEFLVGREGAYDQIVASAVKRAKRIIRNDNSTLVWVMPYKTAEYERNVDYYEDYYDRIEVCDAAMLAHYKSAYRTRNQSMVDRSDLVAFWVEHSNGGAYQTICYARKKGSNYLNLAETQRKQ